MRSDGLDALAFGLTLAGAWQEKSRRIKFNEVSLFQALRKLLVGLSGQFHVEEYHGTGHQVRFTGFGPGVRAKSCCELADLMIIVFSDFPEADVRLTFLQAKREKGTSRHGPLRMPAGPFQFQGNSEQLFLLKNRPLIEGVGRFRPPTTLLKDALLDSVGTFGVFHRFARKKHGFFYSAADEVVRKAGGRGRTAKFAVASPSLTLSSYPRPEVLVADGMWLFGWALHSGLIGTPILPWSGQSAIHQEHGRAVRSWLHSLIAARLELQTTAESPSGGRPVARRLLTVLGEYGMEDGYDHDAASLGPALLLVDVTDRRR